MLVNALDVVHLSNSLLSFLLTGITNETEATAATSIAVLDDNLGERVSIVLTLLVARALTASST